MTKQTVYLINFARKSGFLMTSPKKCRRPCGATKKRTSFSKVLPCNTEVRPHPECSQFYIQYKNKTSHITNQLIFQEGGGYLWTME